VNHHFSAIIEVKHDDFEHVARPVRSEYERSHRWVVVAHVGNDGCLSDGVKDVIAVDSMFARWAMKLHMNESYYGTLLSATLWQIVGVADMILATGFATGLVANPVAKGNTA
jgi:hypothetical protein